MIRSAVTALVLASLAALPLGCERNPAAPAAETVKLGAPVEMSIPVKGMHCEGCEGAICGKVEKIEGVTAVKASHVDEAVVVTAPPEQRTAIEAAIKKLGYQLN
ncbi:MAG: Heavy-metal-associated domain [Planctomycetota bacterium]|jgi:copper chaperone CopZ